MRVGLGQLAQRELEGRLVLGCCQFTIQLENCNSKKARQKKKLLRAYLVEIESVFTLQLVLLKLRVAHWRTLKIASIFALNHPLLSDFYCRQLAVDAVSAHLAFIDANNSGAFAYREVSRDA